MKDEPKAHSRPAARQMAVVARILGIVGMRRLAAVPYPYGYVTISSKDWLTSR